MANLVRINKDFSITANFWILNPQLAIMSPFKDLYATDNGGITSSKYMWVVFFMRDPDEELNKFFRLEKDKRMEMLAENYFPEINWTLPEYLAALEAYPELCQSSIERALREELESLRKRSKLLRDTEYTLDVSIPVDGKMCIQKETATQLDGMRAKTEKIYESLEKTIGKFTKAKEEDARIFGGRKKTPHERGLL